MSSVVGAVVRGGGWGWLWVLAGLFTSASAVLGAEPASAPETPAAAVAGPPQGTPVKALNRELVRLRGSFNGWPPQVRAAAAQQRIKDMLESDGPQKVSLQQRPEGVMVLVDDQLMFGVAVDDTIERTVAAATADAQQAAATLELAIRESREGRDLEGNLIAAAVVAVATATLLLLLWLLRRLRFRLQNWLQTKTLRHADVMRVGGLQLVGGERLVALERGLLKLLHVLLAAVLIYEWLGITLAQFPYTRVWGEQLNAYFWGVMHSFLLAIVHAVPDLFAAVLIFVIAYYTTRLLKRFFTSVQRGQVELSWIAPEVALTTSRLCVVAVWLFALAMAFPYLPGSNTDAFKGVSVLLGLMISLGASNLVGQGASGLILTYTRIFRAGEYVRVGDHEGTVVSLGAFTTRMRTGLGEELTLSNSLVLGAVTKNYSRAVKGVGFVVDTSVTIGYDTPWRQVNELLIQAALRTPGVLADPPPQVFQTALSDYYPEYRLVCQAVPSQPRPRAEVMSALHANIQDLFNEHGVQIMSPHYRGDPEIPKLVQPEQWYAPPARRPEG